MTNTQLLTVCVSLVLGVCGVATIFVSGWVKASQISKLQSEIDKLWERVSEIAVLKSKLETIADDVKDIKKKLFE
jgi:outer membrane murein-binding lipoprotein Lpp